MVNERYLMITKEADHDTLSFCADMRAELQSVLMPDMAFPGMAWLCSVQNPGGAGHVLILLLSSSRDSVHQLHALQLSIQHTDDAGRTTSSIDHSALEGVVQRGGGAHGLEHWHHQVLVSVSVPTADKGSAIFFTRTQEEPSKLVDWVGWLGGWLQLFRCWMSTHLAF